MVGVSHWHAPMHLRALEACPAAIVGVCDPDARVASEWSERTGARSFTEVSEALERTDPDLVVAMGQAQDVLATVNTIIDADVPCVVEKPIGASALQVAPLVRKAEQRGAFVSVPLVNRFSALWEIYEELEREGRLGALLHAHFRVVNGPASRYRDMGVPWMLEPRVAGGGCLRNLGVHAVDAALTLLGRADVGVRSALVRRRDPTDAIESFAAATLESGRGVVTLEAGYTFGAATGGDTEWRVATENAYLIDRNQRLRRATLDDGVVTDTEIPSVATRYDQYMRDVLDRVRDGRQPRISLAEYAQAMSVIDSIYARAGEARR